MTTRPVSPSVPASPLDGAAATTADAAVIIKTVGADAVAEDPAIHYPSNDGEPMAATDAQRRPLVDTSEALLLYYIHRADVYVSADLFIYYEINRPERSVAPDVFVVFGVGNHPRDSYFIWREGKAPDFVLEIASTGTQGRDAVAKRAIYAAMGVTEYWRFDPTGRYLRRRLVGERLNAQGEYEPIPLSVSESDEIVRGYSPTLGLDLCVRAGGELRLYDPVAQQWLPTFPEETAARQAAEERAEVAEERALVLENLLREHGIALPNGV